MRQCAALEAEGYPLALHILLPHAGNHLRSSTNISAVPWYIIASFAKPRGPHMLTTPLRVSDPWILSCGTRHLSPGHRTCQQLQEKRHGGIDKGARGGGVTQAPKKLSMSVKDKQMGVCEPS